MGRVLVLYHYFHPDNVVSAIHYSHLAEDLRARGWDVVVLTSNRSRHDRSISYPPREQWNGVDIRRMWRPNFSQESGLWRLITAKWMVLAWSLAALRKRSLPNIDVMIVGTDPVMSIACIPFWKLVRPRTKVVHWCFDLFPDIAIADGMLKESSPVAKIIKKVCAWIYRKCDLIVDTSPCQRDRLKTYIATARHATCTPWAVVEPPTPVPVDDTERKALFGDTNLALIYSGNIGRAHHFDLILELARRLRDTGASMAFAVRGNGIPALKQAVLDTDTNIRFGEFVSQDRLEKRLSAADIHLLSLRPEWTGTLVPSKFFGAIAVGRPVIFLGSPKSGIAQWTKAYGLGWVLTPDTIDRVTREVAQLPNDPAAAAALRERCFRTYHEHFSRKSVMDNWDRELRAVVQS